MAKKRKKKHKKHKIHVSIWAVAGIIIALAAVIALPYLFDRKSVEKGAKVPSGMYGLNVQNRRQILVSECSDGLYEVAGLLLRVFRRTEEMVCSSSDLPLAGLLPVSAEVLVLHGCTFRSLDEYI